jgi:4-hydroxybenzoyl-CoA reductase subunit beta
MTLPAFEVLIPSSLSEALVFLQQHSANTKIYAGGTDLVPSLKQRLYEPDYLLDIKNLSELAGIQERSDGSLRIGALTTIAEISRSGLIAAQYSALQQAAATVAGPNLRNVGTLGGNLCLDTRCYWYNQSFFWRQACGFCIKKDGTLCHVAPGSKVCWAVYSGDTAAALLTMNAKIKLASALAERIVPLAEFFVNEGRIKSELQPDEILTEVIIPSEARGYSARYDKFRLRGSVDYPLAGVAVSIKKANGQIEDLRIALTAVNPMPVLVKDAWNAYISDSVDGVKKLVAKTAKPLKTSASTMEYRRHMVGVFIQRSLASLGVS